MDQEASMPMPQQEAIQQAEALIQSGRYDEAVARLDDLLSEDPRNTELLNDLGVALFKKKDWDGTLDTYLRAIEADPTHAVLWENLGELVRRGSLSPDRLEAAYARLATDRATPLHRRVLQRIGQDAPEVADYRAAFAQADITPKGKCVTQGWLSGQVADKAIAPLLLQALLLEDGENNKILIAAVDLLGVGEALLQTVRVEARQWGIPPEAVIFNASHTHYAPGAVEKVIPGLGSYHASYVRQVGSIVQRLLPHLHDQLESCLVYAGKAKAQIGVNRRRKNAEGAVNMEPNPEGYYHEETPVLAVDLLAKEASIVIVNHGCHPTGSGNPVFMSPGYPGYLRQKLIEGGTVDGAMFLQGAAGSAKLALNGEGDVRFTGSPGEAERSAGKLADAVVEVIDTGLAPVRGPVFARIERLQLPLNPAPTKAQLQAMPMAKNGSRRVLEERWAEGLLAEAEPLPDVLDLEVQLVGLGEDIGFITFPGEPVAELARNLLNAASVPENTFILGYTNGLKAYLPTKDIVEEGGYEGDDASMVYMLPARFQPAVEDEIMDGVQQLVQAWQAADAPNGYGRYQLAEAQGEAFFCLSTGRCGTKTLAHLLSTASNARVYHHPRPYLVEETLAAYQDRIDRGQTFWRARGGVVRDAWKDGLIFGETDHNMTAFAPAINEEIEGAKFIVLVRNPWDFVRSGMRRQYYRGHPWDAGRLCPELGHPDHERWDRMPAFEKVCWLWNETYQRISRIIEDLPAERYQIVRFEELVEDEQATRELFEFLGLEGFDAGKVKSLLGRKLNRQTQGTYERPEAWGREQHETLWAACQVAADALQLKAYQEMYASYIEKAGSEQQKDSHAGSAEDSPGSDCESEAPGLRHDVEEQSSISATTILDYKKFKYQAYPEEITPATIIDPRAKRALIGRETPIASMGSCFARNVAAYLLKNGYNYLVTEKRPLQQASAHWGQVFNTACMRQIFEYSLTEVWDPVVRWWPKGKEVQDPYRYEILYPASTCDERFEKHRKASRRALQEARVVILTLGLIETWRDQRDHATYYRVPSPSVYDPDVHEFYVQTVEDCTQDLDRIHELLAASNSDAEIVITVSPVPLFATFRMDVDVVAANRLSKSTLRVAAEYFAQKHDNVHYFPAYEIVTQGVDNPYEEDNRHVTDATIATVMQSFEALFTA